MDVFGGLPGWQGRHDEARSGRWAESEANLPAIPKMELLGGIEGKRESNASLECGKTEGLC
jgi:hypothetical protein